MVQKVQLETTIPIPGGKASFFKKNELSPRRDREIEVIAAQMNSAKLKRLQAAVTVVGEGETGGEVLTETEARLMLSITEVGAWAYLKSWSLKVDGEPRPLPDSPDGWLDVPKNIYDPITAHVAKILAADIDAGFGLESFEDQESPTGV